MLSEVDKLLSLNNYKELYSNDQLSIELAKTDIFKGLVEGPLRFRPTYKFDRGSDRYDSSAKERIPSWTDRIFYRPEEGVRLFSYRSIDTIKTSDHRPVCASFEMPLSLKKIEITPGASMRRGGGSISESWDGQVGQSHSAVCQIQ